MGDFVESVRKLTFTSPIDIPRPRFSHRFELWSPKMGRRLTLYHPLTLDAWAMLEGNPQVKQLCERPYSTQGKSRRLVVDFWCRTDSGDEFLFVSKDDRKVVLSEELERLGGFKAWSDEQGIKLRVVSEKDIYAEPILLRNTRVILHYLAANHRFVNSDLLQSLRRQVDLGPRSICELESAFDDTDPILLRTAIYLLIYSGELIADTLMTAELCAETQVRQL